MTKIPGLNHRFIIRVYQFGSSVEGKARPRDVDYFVIVDDATPLPFKRQHGIYMPIVKHVGKNEYFIMPESDGNAEGLLEAMLYTGRKDQERFHRGIKWDVTRFFTP